jgi:hypothetical protein
MTSQIVWTIQDDQRLHQCHFKTRTATCSEWKHSQSRSVGCLSTHSSFQKIPKYNEWSHRHDRVYPKCICGNLKNHTCTYLQGFQIKPAGSPSTRVICAVYFHLVFNFKKCQSKKIVALRFCVPVFRKSPTKYCVVYTQIAMVVKQIIRKTQRAPYHRGRSIPPFHMCLHTSSSESAMPFPPAKLHAFLRRKMPTSQPRVLPLGGDCQPRLQIVKLDWPAQGAMLTCWIHYDGHEEAQPVMMPKAGRRVVQVRVYDSTWRYL